MGTIENEKDKTAGQPRRSTDSRPRPGTNVPEADPTGEEPQLQDEGPSLKGERKPSESWSPIDPGRPTKGG